MKEITTDTPNVLEFVALMHDSNVRLKVPVTICQTQAIKKPFFSRKKKGSMFFQEYGITLPQIKKLQMLATLAV